MTLSPLATTLLRALRDNPAWADELPSWIAVALWAHGYTDHKPPRVDVAWALEELARQRRRAA